MEPCVKAFRINLGLYPFSCREKLYTLRSACKGLSIAWIMPLRMWWSFEMKVGGTSMYIKHSPGTISVFAVSAILACRMILLTIRQLFITVIMGYRNYIILNTIRRQ